MKRIQAVISSDSDEDKRDQNDKKKLKKDFGVYKGLKKITKTQNQMSIEAAFSKVIASTQNTDNNSDNVIKKIPKLSKKNLMTETFSSTKCLSIPDKNVASTSNSSVITKVETTVKDVSKSKATDTQSTKVTPPVSAKSKAAFVQFLHRSGPSAVGSKEIPQGAPNCLNGMTFVITGVLSSIERNDAESVIERHGGKVTKAVSGRTTYLVVGNEPGNSKLQKAEKLKTKQINEDQLFDLIRNSSPILSHNSNTSPTTKKHTPEITPSKIVTKNPPITKNTTKQAPSKKSASSLSSKGSSLSSDPIITRRDIGPPVTSSSSSLLVDKYSPMSLNEIIGQQGDRSPANKLFAWLQNFDHNLQSNFGSQNDDNGAQFRAVLLSGPPGIGKTTTARVVSQQLGYNAVELNASSVRSKISIQANLSESLTVLPFYNKRGLKHCVIMDEIDGMAGNEDRGGINELIQIIKTTKHPIICICNDRQSRKLQSFVKYVYDLRFRHLTLDQMKAALVPIIRAEQMVIADDVVQFIIKSSNFDMRQVLNNLQMWSVGNRENETLRTEAKNSCKEFKLGPFDVIQKVFSHENVRSFSEKSDLFFYDYQLCGLFVQENYPLVRPYSAKGDVGKTLKLMSLAADSIAMGDIVSTKIHSSNNWNLLPTQAMFSSVIPGEYLHGRISARIEFPSWLGKYSKANKNSRILSSVSCHLCLSSKCGLMHATNLSMDYGDLVIKKLLSPLQEGDVETVLATLDKFQIQKEDMDLLAEAMAWKHVGNPLSAVGTQIKSTLTRAFNKSNFKVPYANVSVKKSLKLSEPVLDVAEGDEEMVVLDNEDNEENEMDVDSDVMITKKDKSKVTKKAKTDTKKRQEKEKTDNQPVKRKKTK